jgi:hypothetical protein
MGRQQRGTKRPGVLRGYSFAWVTAGFFIISFIGHWLLGWLAFANEQRAHSQPVEVSEYVVQMTRDTLENWQSEFLQVLWQVAGLSFLLYVGSPQSKEGSERVEAKIDELLRCVEPKGADKLLAKLDRDFPRTG